MAKETKTGLVIRQDCIEWATVRRVRGGFETVSSGSVEIVKPAGGDDQAAAVEEARTATAERLQKALGKAPGEVVLGLSPEHVLVRVVELPTVEAGELPGMVELQVDRKSVV